MEIDFQNHSSPIHEVEIHYKRPHFDMMEQVTCSSDADQISRKFINENRIDLKEFFWVILLNNSNKVLGVSEISSGGPTGVIVNVREILMLLIKTNSNGVILGHNHPSGKLAASEADKRLTKDVQSLATIMSAKVLDHIILTSEDYFSFSDNGLI